MYLLSFEKQCYLSNIERRLVLDLHKQDMEAISPLTQTEGV
jgi:hypothetical protein